MSLASIYVCDGNYTTVRQSCPKHDGKLASCSEISQKLPKERPIWITAKKRLTHEREHTHTHTRARAEVRTRGVYNEKWKWTSSPSIFSKTNPTRSWHRRPRLSAADVEVQWSVSAAVIKETGGARRAVLKQCTRPTGEHGSHRQRTTRQHGSHRQPATQSQHGSHRQRTTQLQHGSHWQPPTRQNRSHWQRTTQRQHGSHWQRTVRFLRGPHYIFTVLTDNIYFSKQKKERKKKEKKSGLPEFLWASNELFLYYTHTHARARAPARVHPNVIIR